MSAICNNNGDVALQFTMRASLDSYRQLSTHDYYNARPAWKRAVCKNRWTDSYSQGKNGLCFEKFLPAVRRFSQTLS